MSGLQHILIKPSGNKILGLICSCIIVLLVASGCIPRGDWDYELISGYSLVRTNAHSIVLTHTGDSEDAPSEIVIEQYYVTQFCFNDRYIGLQGILTQGHSATDKELSGEERAYYLVNVADGTIVGPFLKKDEFDIKCEEADFENMDEWISTKMLDMSM